MGKQLFFAQAIFAKKKPSNAEQKSNRRITKPGKGGNYGIPDFTCRRIDDWALRANYCRLFETARMVIVKSKRRSASGRP
jgi:hypothetical protein